MNFYDLKNWVAYFSDHPVTVVRYVN